MPLFNPDGVFHRVAVAALLHDVTHHVAHIDIAFHGQAGGADLFQHIGKGQPVRGIRAVVGQNGVFPLWFDMEGGVERLTLVK